MQDLNKIVSELQGRSAALSGDLRSLLSVYESLLREGNHILLKERTASNDKDLDDFIRLMNLVKRNRDVIGSLLRGSQGLRSLSGFKFVEEDIKDEVING